jgi:hypothetical protein
MRTNRFSQNERRERQSHVQPTTSPLLRAQLRGRGIDPSDLTDLEVFHLSCALRGWHVTPRTAAGTRAIDGRVWLAAALGTGGRYHAPVTPGHPADLRDGGPFVDSVILMAVVQRHFLAEEQPAWDDVALGDALGLEPRDVARAQAVLDATQAVVPRARPPLGPGWWRRTPRAPAPDLA